MRHFVALVVLSSVLSFLALPCAALAAGGSLYLSPSYGVHAVGQTFTVNIYVDTGDTAINAAEAQLSFDASALSVDNVSTAHSILSSWPTTPSFSNANGTIRFTGWTTNPYTGAEGQLLSVTFTALRNVTTTLRFDSGTILAADASDSNIITSMRAATLALKPLEVVPPAPASAPDAITITPDPPPAPPVFATASPTVAAGSNLVIKGSAAKRSTVYIWLQKGQGPPQRTTLSVGPDGSFTYVSGTPVTSGTYSLWAQAENANGQKSTLSKKVTVTAAAGSLAAAAALALRLPGTAVPYAMVLGLLLSFGAGYLFRRYQSARG